MSEHEEQEVVARDGCRTCLADFIGNSEPGIYTLLRCAHVADERLVVIECPWGHYHLENLKGDIDKVISSRTEADEAFNAACERLLSEETL